MMYLDPTICPSCGRSITVCRQSFLGALAAEAKRETLFWELVAPIGVTSLTALPIELAGHAWHALISALVEAEHLSWTEAHAKAAAMIEEVNR